MHDERQLCSTNPARSAASGSAGKQQWRALPFMPDPAIKFDYEISMGVRFGERQWQNTVDAWIGSHQSQINTILTSYRVPLLDAGGAVLQTNLESGT